ncbi:hypothetical protein ACROYT_G017772 [Oculina patagonica]
MLIFAGCLVLQIQCQTFCKSDQYTVVTSNGHFVRCLNCDTCHPGRGLYPRCGSHILQQSNIECKDCSSEKFSSEYDSAPCHNCQKCAKHEIIAAPCTNMSDRICNGTCEKGYFYSKKDSTHSCQKCAYCCFDGKDEEISECTNQGLNVSKQHCRPRPDKDCSPVPSSTSPTGLASGTKASKSGSPSKATIIAGVISSVVFVALVVLFVHLYRRKKHKGVPHVQPPGSAEEGNGRTNSVPSGYAIEGPQAESTDTKVKFTLPDEEIDPKDNLGLDKSAFEQKCNEAAATPTNSADNQVVKLPKRGSKSSLNRQISQDSQNSGDGEVGFRKRSNSAISFEKLKRKLSERDDSLLEEDTDEIHEPIKIDRQPKSRKQKEGSKVEFKFRAQGTSTLLYQWYKDGVELLGQNNASLILECIELRDFGHYTCRVSYQDGYGIIIESSSAVLDVIPQCRNGMRPKLLQEVDLNTRDKIACLLENKRYSLGGCRQVADKYGMKEDKIGALDNSREPGKDVMEFLMGSKPDLTVYSFCKVMKEDKIERFDIAKLLEDHLLIRDGATYYL